MRCKICNHFDCVDYVIMDKKVIRCTLCHAMYSEEASKYPSISDTGKIKNLIRKRFARLIAENYFSHLKIKTTLQFKTALDVGAGFGSFVEILREHGINAEGIESDEKTVKNSKTNLTLGVFDENYPYKKYDLISINQCLYYFNDCFSILKKVSELLSNEGILFIATINPESTFRLENKSWTQGFIVVLSEKNFASLSNLGLELVDVTSYDDNLYIDYFLHKNNLLTTKIFFVRTLFYFLKLRKLTTNKQDGINNFYLLRKINNKMC